MSTNVGRKSSRGTPGRASRRLAEQRKNAVVAHERMVRDETRFVRNRIKEIQEIWRSPRRPTGAYGTRKGFLRREVYRLAIELEARQGAPTVLPLLNALRKEDNSRARPKNSVTLALLGLIVSDDELVRSEQHRFADELEYALRHRVPVELLIGFIHQAGPVREVRQKLEDDQFEPWYRPGERLEWREDRGNGET